jgi:hypothetical protein
VFCAIPTCIAKPAMSPAAKSIAPRIQPPEMDSLNGPTHSATNRKSKQARGIYVNGRPGRVSRVL